MSLSTSATIIVGIAPIIVSGFMFVLIAIPGLIVSPIAGLIAWWSARSRWSKGGREALAGVAYSICLFLPWILLVVALRRGSLSSSAVNKCYILLYLAWLIGPLITFGIMGANLQTLDFDPRPNFWWVSFTLFLAMVFLWIGSAAMTLKWWSGAEDVTVERLTSFRFITPYALASVCLWTLYIYMRVWEQIDQPCIGLDATSGACIP